MLRETFRSRITCQRRWLFRAFRRPPPFAQTNNCGATLGPGASCTLSVTFSPAAVQSYTGSITVTDSDPSSPQSVALSGSGIAPVTFTPKLIPFPNQPINSTSTASVVTFTNNQATAISIAGIATPAPFAQTNNCGTSLGAGASCTVNVTFAPTAVKYYSSSLTITDNTATSPHVVSVTGNGYLPVKFSPLVISFPQQATGTTSSGYSVSRDERATRASEHFEYSDRGSVYTDKQLRNVIAGWAELHGDGEVQPDECAVLQREPDDYR